MSKQLRLSVGALTDVGRRRERNQDNVTHFVPADADLLSRRGALFVVCDGMGGHAAGEIASQIAVEAIREQYYLPSDDDVIMALARAIRTANAAIYDHARTTAGHGGMGTTCVALALVGGRGFFANIGDSRAYILRKGTLRQVTLDHSWVAEQVRAGVLTEDQARTHAHRNVITRSLGTQPEVTADLFIEEMATGDRVLLCSDGLHGYVAAADIQRVLAAEEPEAGVHRLIDMANANGGPDNITAVFVHLSEVPPITDVLHLPDVVRVPERDAASDDTLILSTGPLPAVARGAAAHAAPAGDGRIAIAARAPTSPREPAAAAPSPRRARVPVALRALAVAALCLISAGVWYVAAGPYAAGRGASAQVQRDIATADAVARGAPSQDTRSALAALASVQQTLQHDLAALPLQARDRAQLHHTLDAVVAPAVRNVLAAYDQANQIVALTGASVKSYPVSCAGASFAAAPATLAEADPGQQAGQPAPAATLYGLTAQGALYTLTLGPGGATCASAPQAQDVHAVTADGPHVFALAQQGLSWVVLEVTAGAAPSLKLTLPPLASAAPTGLAVHGDDYYVAYQGEAGTPGPTGVWHFSGASATALQKPVQTVLLTTGVAAIGVAASGIPFALLRNGALATWDTSGVATAVPVALTAPLVDWDPTAYASATPVPTLGPVAASPAPVATATATTVPTVAPTAAAKATPATGTAAATPTPTPAPTPQAVAPVAGSVLFGGSSSLAADRGTSTDLVVGDGTAPRVVRFAVNGSSLQLVHQYVYGPPLAALQAVTVSADGTRLFAWSGGQLVVVTLPV